MHKATTIWTPSAWFLSLWRTLRGWKPCALAWNPWGLVPWKGFQRQGNFLCLWQSCISTASSFAMCYRQSLINKSSFEDKIHACCYGMGTPTRRQVTRGAPLPQPGGLRAEVTLLLAAAFTGSDGRPRAEGKAAFRFWVFASWPSSTFLPSFSASLHF